MGRRIVVMSNCQTGGLHAALAAMLPDDEVEALAWLGVEPPGLAERLRGADAWVCSIPREQAEAIASSCGSDARIVVVPTIWFSAFHPDQTAVITTEGTELIGALGPYHSRMVVWGWSHGVSVEQVVETFRPEVFAALGYVDLWPHAVDWLRGIFAPTDCDLGQWLLPLVPRGAFMLTNNHPRIDALVQLARLAATQLGADEELVRYGWEQVIPDGLLASSAVWPIYPGVADALDLPGAFVWRSASGELIGLEDFVARSFAAYEEVDPATLDTAPLDDDPSLATAFAPVVGATRGA